MKSHLEYMHQIPDNSKKKVMEGNHETPCRDFVAGSPGQIHRGIWSFTPVGNATFPRGGSENFFLGHHPSLQPLFWVFPMITQTKKFHPSSNSLARIINTIEQWNQQMAGHFVTEIVCTNTKISRHPCQNLLSLMVEESKSTIYRLTQSDNIQWPRG